MDLVEVSQRIEIIDFYSAYAAALDDGDLESWPGFFTEDCLYQVIPRDNHDKGLPLAVIRCESRGMLQDRVTAVRETTMFAPRYLRHLISNIRIVGQSEDAYETRANYAVFETLSDEHTRVFNVGRYLDRLVREDGELRFAEKICVYDSILVPNSIVYPI